MGGASSTGSSGTTTETALSTKQAEILSQREKQYQALFFPALTQEMNRAMGTSVDAATAEPLARSVNQSFSSSQNAFKQAMAQRGLTGSGVETMGNVGLTTARGQSLAGAFQQAQSDQQTRRLQLIQMGGSFSPSPTTAAPLGQTNTSSGGGWNIV